MYVPCTKDSEVTVPSAPVVKSNVVPSGCVTVNTALAKAIVLSSSSTFVNLILFARSPDPEPPEEALVKLALKSKISSLDINFSVLFRFVPSVYVD